MLDNCATFLNVYSRLERGTPSFEPLDPAETADMLHLSNDPRIVSQIAEHLLVARELVENEINVSLATRTVTLYLDYFPSWEVEIRLPPLQSVASIVYLNTIGTSLTLDPSQYLVDTTGKPGRITPAYALIWPWTYPVQKAITITATVGYTDASLVPACAKQAMRFMARMMFDGVWCEDGMDIARRMLDPIRWEGYA